MKLTKANLKDINELEKLELSVFDEFNFPLSKANFRYHIKNNYLIKAIENEQILGYILVLTKFKVPRIYSLAVSKDARGKGVASKLLDLVCAKFSSLRLEVRSDNAPAISLYKKLGFSVKKTLPRYYNGGGDGVLMLKISSS